MIAEAPAIVRAVDTEPVRTAQRRLRARKRDAAAEWRGMSWAEKEAKARNFVNQTWRATAALYGQAGQPPPKFSFSSEGSNQTEPNREVKFSPAMVQWLAQPKILGGKSRAEARETVLHEFAHANQDQSFRESAPTQQKEEAAQLFATYWAHKLFGAAKMTKRGALPYGNRPAASRDLASAYGKGYWRRRQFSSY